MTKEQLRAYRALRKERDKLLRDLEDLEAKIYGYRSPQWSDMPKSKRDPRTDPRDSLIPKRDRVKALYKAKVIELTEAILKIEKAIERLSPNERMVVRLHYIDGLKWDQVCVEIGYEWAQTHRIHASALRKLREETDECD